MTAPIDKTARQPRLTQVTTAAKPQKVLKGCSFLLRGIVRGQAIVAFANHKVSVDDFTPRTITAETAEQEALLAAEIIERVAARIENDEKYPIANLRVTLPMILRYDLLPELTNRIRTESVCLIRAAQEYFAEYQSNVQRQTGSSADKDKLLDNISSLLVDLLNQREAIKEDVLAAIEAAEGPVVVVCSDIPDSYLSLIVNPKVVGIIRQKGGKRDHKSIAIKEAQKIGVVGVAGAAKIEAGDNLLLDGFKGNIYANPTERTLALAAGRMKAYEGIRLELVEDRVLSTVTLDGRRIELNLNLDARDRGGELFTKFGYDAVGLVRGESVLALDRYGRERKQALSIEKQIAIFKRIGGSLPAGVKTYFRVIEVDEDKGLPYFSWDENVRATFKDQGLAAYLNPQNLALHYLLRDNLEALLCAKEVKAIMFPNAFSLQEFVLAMVLVKQLESKHPQLFRRGRFKNKQFGLMVEDPRLINELEIAAASGYAQLGIKLAAMRQLEFLSLGTNDLTKRSTGCTRTDDGQSGFDERDPRVIKNIGRTVRVAAALNLPLSACGDMADDPQSMVVLIGSGLTSFSVSPACVDVARKMIRSITFAGAEQLVSGLQGISTAEQVEATINQFISDKIQTDWSGLAPIKDFVL